MGDYPERCDRDDLLGSFVVGRRGGARDTEFPKVFNKLSCPHCSVAGRLL
jgi:hypothetical protein